MDIQAMIDSLPEYQAAMATTLKLALVGIVLAIIIGLICSYSLFFKVPILRTIVSAYVELSRNTPLLIQLFFLYYGLPRIGITFSKDMCGIIGLAFLGGGYMSEAFRGGLESVPEIQLDSGRAIGLSKFQLARYVVFPQGFTLSVPALSANCLFLIKETSVFSAISIMDLTNTTRDLIGMYYLTSEYLLMLVLSYAVVLLPLGLLFSFIERKVRYGSFGN